MRAALEERFGTTDRARIGEIVFADRDELAWLEGLLHPRVRREEERWFEALDAPVAATEIPLLYESGGEARFDAVVVITAPDEVRAARSRHALDAEGRPPDPRRGEGAPRRLRLRERRHPRGARRVRRAGARRSWRSDVARSPAGSCSG